MKISILDTAVSERCFHGIGVQSDFVLYSDVNREYGVNEQDINLLESRLKALSPSIARIFFEVDKVKSDFDVPEFDAQSVYFQDFVRMLRLLQEIDCRVNVVLFGPYRVETGRLPAVVQSMVAILDYAVSQEEISNIGWLTLYNEPDSMFFHESPLSSRIFGNRETLHRWQDYVDINVLAYDLLKKHKLYPQVKLVVADTVYGSPIRRERMKLCYDAFADLDVIYSYHNYNPEYSEFYQKENPDFHYDGMAEETRFFRETLETNRPLVIWEANLAGVGFGAYFPGTDRYGCHVLETREGGVELLDKIFRAVNNGLDGFCLWCFNDIAYGDPRRHGIMRFGLGRFKHENWTLRPYSHYYAVVCRHLRPGAEILKVDGAKSPVNILVARKGGEGTIFLINTGKDEQSVTITHPFTGRNGQIMRLSSETITDHANFANEHWEDHELPGTAKFDLNPSELLLWTDNRSRG